MSYRQQSEIRWRAGAVKVDSLHLLPCPFCGGSRVRFKKEWVRRKGSEAEIKALGLGEFERYKSRVECVDCWGTGPQGKSSKDMRDASDFAAGFWNHRADIG